MTSDEEILGIALHAHREHGALAPRWIAEQIGRNVLAGDTGGIELWKTVSSVWEELTAGTRQ